MDDRIDQAEIDRALRQTCRRVASALIKAMADEDVSFAEIAKRLGRKEKTVGRWLRTLIAGRPIDLDHVSDMCTAMDCQLVYSVEHNAQDQP